MAGLGGAYRFVKTVLVVIGIFGGALLVALVMFIVAEDFAKPLTPEQQAYHQQAAIEAEKRAAIQYQESNRRGLRHAACEKAIEAVTARLKAPSTAKFPGCFWSDGEYRVAVDENEVWVHGHVDAQNGFGAMLRSPWTVVYDRVAGMPDGLLLRGVSIDGQWEIPPPPVRHRDPDPTKVWGQLSAEHLKTSGARK